MSSLGHPSTNMDQGSHPPLVAGEISLRDPSSNKHRGNVLATIWYGCQYWVAKHPRIRALESSSALFRGAWEFSASY